jgi:hypothetical protein
MQKGPTSARKTDPPRFKGTLCGAIPLATATLFWSCSYGAVLLRFVRRVKRSRALRRRNPTRDSPADGAPMVHLFEAHTLPQLLGTAFLPPIGHRSLCLRKSRGSGGRAPGALTLGGSWGCFSRCSFSSCFSSTPGSESFHHSSRKCYSGASSDPVTPLSSARPGTPGPTR